MMVSLTKWRMASLVLSRLFLRNGYMSSVFVVKLRIPLQKGPKIFRRAPAGYLWERWLCYRMADGKGGIGRKFRPNPLAIAATSTIVPPHCLFRDGGRIAIARVAEGSSGYSRYARLFLNRRGCPYRVPN